MAQKVIMPQMGESVVQGTVAKWLVKEGERVAPDQPLVEVSTDKVDVEIPSPGAGVLARILVREGQTVDVGAELALIDGERDSAAGGSSRPPQQAERAVAPAPSPSAPAAPSPAREDSDQRQRLSPLARRLAREYGLDLAKVKGTGLEGRVTKDDVLRFVGEKAATPADLTPAPTAPEAPPRKSAPAAETAGAGEFRPPRYEVKEGDRVIPFTRMRKLISEHMVASQRISAHVTTVAEVDFTEIARLREERRHALKEKEGIDLTFLPFVVVATVGALKEYPALNASVADEKIIIKKEINMGIAVETDAGLIVPVLHRADELSILGIAKAIGDLAEKAREKRLSPQEVSGGTFTVTNPGRKGNLFGTPIIFQPQVGILRLGEVRKRPAVIQVGGEDALAIRSMMYLSLSYDHRVIDGVTGNSFLHRIRELLESGPFAF